MIGSATLRPEQPGDEPFLYQLFAQARSAIIASLPLGHITAETLLRQQFELQTSHFRSYYPSAEYCIIEQEDTPVGRLVVDYSGQAIRIIEGSVPACFTTFWLMPGRLGKSSDCTLNGGILR
jgi:hypothetical protein